MGTCAIILAFTLISSCQNRNAIAINPKKVAELQIARKKIA